MTILSRAFRLVTVLAPPNDDSRELIPRKTSACYSALTNTTPSLRQTDRAEGRPPGRGIRVVDTRHYATAVLHTDDRAIDAVECCRGMVRRRIKTSRALKLSSRRPSTHC